MIDDRRGPPIWWLIAGMAATCLIACRGLGFHVDAVRALPLAAALIGLALATRFGIRHHRPRLAAGAEAFLQMTLFTVIGVVLAYALAARGGPLWDDSLAATDRTLGFDWPAVFARLDESWPALWIGGIAYHSLTVQMIVAIVVLSGTGRFATLRTAVMAAILGGFATILISGVTPATGNVFDPGHYHHLWPSVAWTERAMIAGLRAGTFRTLDLTQLMGIVTFPSYHATLPIILAWAQRDVKGWQIVAPIWAGVTIVATPVFGGHYGIDVLAGIALAPLSILAVKWFARGARREKERAVSARVVTEVTG